MDAARHGHSGHFDPLCASGDQTIESGAAMTGRADENRFSNILVYVPAVADDDDAGLRRAVDLARADGAVLTLADVAYEPTSALGRALHPGARARPEEQEQRAARLEDRVAALRRDGIVAESMVLTGADWIELVRAVQRHHFDLVVKTARPDDEDKGMRIGALAVRLFRTCPCPVWVEQASANGCARIAAAIAPNPDADGLNEAVMKNAARVADRTGAELHVVHAWTLFGQELLSHRMPREELAVHVDDARQEARESMRESLARMHVTVPDDRLHFIKGDPEAAIPACADEVGADLVVVGTFARTGIAGWFVGNTADRILRRITCSVLAVKPADFTSPVHLD